ncbi:homoserine kinase, partial [Staphylococcus hominis]|nr:homoserine kinase [Staphylococcus hominis]
ALVRTLKSEITTCDSELATINNVGVIEEVVYPS